MARHFILLTIALLFVAGCQSQSMVENLPAPNFNGPAIESAPPLAMAMPAWTPLKQATPRSAGR